MRRERTPTGTANCRVCHWAKEARIQQRNCALIARRKGSREKSMEASLCLPHRGLSCSPEPACVSAGRPEGTNHRLAAKPYAGNPPVGLEGGLASRVAIYPVSAEWRADRGSRI